MESDNEFFSFMGLAKDLVTSNRPLRLRLDLPGGVNDDMLLPQRVFGSEALCGGIEYRVLCVSSNASLPLKEMIAVPAALEFVTDTGDLRSVCGIVTEASCFRDRCREQLMIEEGAAYDDPVSIAREVCWHRTEVKSEQ